MHYIKPMFIHSLRGPREIEFQMRGEFTRTRTLYISSVYTRSWNDTSYTTIIGQIRYYKQNERENERRTFSTRSVRVLRDSLGIYLYTRWDLRCRPSIQRNDVYNEELLLPYLPAIPRAFKRCAAFTTKCPWRSRKHFVTWRHSTLQTHLRDTHWMTLTAYHQQSPRIACVPPITHARATTCFIYLRNKAMWSS